jgi:hypothetical protein
LITSDINVKPNRQKHGPFTLPTKTVLNALPVIAMIKARYTSRLVADWTKTGEIGQLLMILTNDAQCRSKGMITPSVSKNCMEYRHTPQNKFWVSFQTPRQLHHSITNEQSGFNVGQIKKD